MFDLGWVNIDRVIEFLGKDDEKGLKWKKDFLQYIKSSLGVGWVSCKKSSHAWEERAKGFFRCSVCGVVGYHRYNSMMGTEGNEIFEYSCPGCKGPTTRPSEPCPKCAGVRRKAGTTICPKLRWDALKPSEQRLITFLSSKDVATTVSFSDGAGMIKTLLKKGIVQNAGDKNGQSLWKLTSAAYEMYHDELTEAGGLDGKKG